MLTPDTVLQSRYRIVRQLGQGGMGTVYEAIDQRLRNTVAIKETLFTDERLRKQFEREAELLARLHHPALPNVSDHFFEGDGQFLVMQFIQGEDLAEKLQNRGGAFALEEVLDWTDQLLDALDYLHTQEPPVIHRDIKPQNLKLTSRGRVILLDFGLAKGFAGQISRVTTSGSIFGYTPNYAPLEQIQGTGTGPHSDLYSLAATAYHLMTGVVPPDVLTRLSATMEGQPDPLRPANEFNAQVPAQVAAILNKAMAIARNQRYGSAAEMSKDLRKAWKAADASAHGDLETAPTAVPQTIESAVQEPERPLVPETIASPRIEEQKGAESTKGSDPTLVATPLISSPAKMDASPDSPLAHKTTDESPVEFKRVGWIVAGLLLLLVAVVLIPLAYFSSTGSDDESETTNTAQGGKYKPNGLEGRITGKVSFIGVAPAPRVIDISADATCKAKNFYLMTEDAIVKDGRVKNVLVYIKEGQTKNGVKLSDLQFDNPSATVALDQSGCQYRPHVLGVQVGQTLRITNSDPTTHNVNIQPKDNPSSNLSQPVGSPPITETFLRSEVLIPIKCNQHPWMKAYVAVLAHPFFAVTGDDGTFQLKGVPPGTYTLAAWHEKFGEKVMQVTVDTSGTINADFSMSSDTAFDMQSNSLLRILPAIDSPMLMEH